MRLFSAVKATLKSKRFWLWQISGAIIYAIPVIIRFATNRVDIPILNFPGSWIGHFIPGNFLEKVFVNAFFPGGAGGIGGEIFVASYKCEDVKGKTKYFSRLGGALLQAAVWSVFQFWGFSLLITVPWGGHGGGNLFEHAVVFPINFVLAAFSIFTPNVVNFLKSNFKNLSKVFKKAAC